MMNKLVRRSCPRFARVVACSLTLLLASELAAQPVRINFRDADIRSVIESVAEITGKSFVLDPRVRGTVTIVAPHPIDESLLYEAILSALQVQGFQAIDDGAIVRIVPFTGAFNTPTDFLGSELATRVFRMTHVKAADILAVVRPIMSRGGLMQAFEAGNSLLVTDTVSQLDRLDELLKDLDAPEQSAIEVVDLRFIRAGEALHIANQMPFAQQQQLSIVEDSFNNRIIIGGARTARLAFRQMVQSIDVPTQSRSAGVEVIYLNYASAANVKVVLDGLLQSQTFLRLAGEVAPTAAAAGSTSGYRVEIDEDNNALVIAASASVMEEIMNVVHKVDRPRRQVLIEAVIAEVTEDQARELSTQLAYVGQSEGGFISRFDDLLLSIIGAGADGDISAPEASAVASQIGSGALGIVGDFDANTGRGFGALIQALKSDSQTRILSTPSVVTLDNEEATLSVGNEVPFVTGSFTAANNAATNPFQTIQRQEVGVMLRVRPQVNEGNAVRLEIQQESSNLLARAQQEFGTADVVTSKRTIQTNVMVGNGEVLILGGLIDESSLESRTRVPLLGDIPLLGRLFSASSRTSDQRVLMMFIRPTILENSAQARQVTVERFEHLRIHQSQFFESSGEGAAPILQDFFGLEPEPQE